MKQFLIKMAKLVLKKSRRTKSNVKLMEKEIEEEVIKTADGKSLPKNQCVFIKHLGCWYSKGHKHIFVDELTGENVDKQYCRELIVDFQMSESRELIVTKKVRTLAFKDKAANEIFSYDIVHTASNTTYNVKLGLASQKGLVEGIKSGFWYHPEDIKLDHEREFNKFSNTINPVDYSDKVFLSKMGAFSPTYNITEGKRYTFGVELETSRGLLPIHLFDKFNLKCVYDGSLKDDNGKALGGEYVTGILTGDKGIEHLQGICIELAKRCKINGKCSVHLHIGNIIFNKSFIVFMYTLAKLLENDLFAMLPSTRKESSFCRELPNLFDIQSLNNKAFNSSEEYFLMIDNIYKSIHEWVSKKQTVHPDKTKDHPMGHNCGYDHSTARYCWLNFVPAIFNIRKAPVKHEKGHKYVDGNPYTLEIRSHSGTLNFNKIINWLKICMGIVYFAENHQKDIMNGYIIIDGTKEPIDLRGVMTMAYPKTYRRLLKYIQYRTELFREKGDKGEFHPSNNKNEPISLKEITGCV